MGDLSVRRNRSFSVPRYEPTAKSEKKSGVGQSRPAQSRAAATVSETLLPLLSRVSQAERQLRSDRRTLQNGEASLAEVAEKLDQMETVAGEAAGDGAADRAGLQASLAQLREEIGRIVRAGVASGLFQDADPGDGLDALVDAVTDGLLAGEGVEALPAWLLRGLSGGAPDRAALLETLGLDEGATGAELLAALGRLSLEHSDEAGRLAALYLGRVISGDSPAEGLRQLLELVSEGVAPDRAVELLTGGLFTGLADFEAQFADGTAPGLEQFLTALLLSGETSPSDAALLGLLAADGDLGLLMDLMAALDSSGSTAAELSLPPQAAADAAAPAGAPDASEAPAANTAAMETRTLGGVQAAGRDLSGVTPSPAGETLEVAGRAAVVLRGLTPDGASPALRLAGPGVLTLQQINVPELEATAGQGQLRVAGEAALGRLRLAAGTVLTVNGGSGLQIGALRAEASGVLRLVGGAVTLEADESDAPGAKLVADGPVSLYAPAGTAVFDARGERLEPMDLLWKALAPSWRAVTALAVDGRQGQLVLADDGRLELLRLWLRKGNDAQGYPAHTITLWGRDRAGELRTQYSYVQWDQKKGRFRTVSMYPNPFAVTGGAQEEDWSYDEPSQTLRIRSGLVTGIAGGSGTDANRLPFCGRIVLDDGIGAVSLTLEGVTCRVSAGRAFYLGAGNDVTLLLRRGTENIFESGPGCAGISLGDGTSLRIDQTADEGAADGRLTAAGGEGGAGIGRDSGGGARSGEICIRGGDVSASGHGGGAGIGGAPGAGVGDIRIQGGAVAARADCLAAAIGAGIQGPCGDVTVAGAARVTGGTVGGCLFGNCGQVRAPAGAALGGAGVWTQRGLSVQLGDADVTLPRFCVSPQALRLETLDVTTQAAARSALSVIAADRRWVTWLRRAYGAMDVRLDQSLGGLDGVRRYLGVVRDAGTAGALLLDVREVLRRSPPAAFLCRPETEDVGRLLR